MMQKLLVPFLTVLIVILPDSTLANEWNQTKNDLTISLASTYLDNLYYQDSNQKTTYSSSLQIEYELLELFEGYGINLPIKLKQKNYFSEAELNHFDYTFTPSLHFFLSEQSDISFHLNSSEEQKIKGENGAEFLPEYANFVDEKQKLAAIKVGLGRAPNTQFLKIEGTIVENQQDHKKLSISETKSQSLAAQYGYKISEDSYALVDGKYKDEQRSSLGSELVEVGFGLYTRLGGTHQFNIVMGYFQRNGDTSSDGYYWLLSDKWSVSENILLSFRSEQHSEISLSQQSFTQLTTENDITLGYQLNSQHYFDLSLAIIDQQFEQADGYHKRIVSAIDWQWQLFEGFNLETSLALEKINTSDLAKQVTQKKANVELEYLW